MKIAICSDSHDNLVNITKFLSYCRKNKIQKILHCGDWCAPSVLKFFREKFKGEIYGVYGNVHADDEIMKKFARDNDIRLKNDELILNLRSVSVHQESQQNKRVQNDAIKIVTIITHYPDNAKKLAETGKYHIVLYGHNHKPWMEKVNPAVGGINETYMINPGTLAGMFQRATFAVYDMKTKKLELKIVDKV